MMKSFHSRAFTLTEVMITLAILAILTTLAYSSYTNSIQKSNRGDAQAALIGLASAMQKYYTETSPSSYAGAAAAGPPGAPKNTVFPSQSPLDASTKLYDLRIQSASATAFELRAVPISGTTQAGDKCGTMTMTNTGVKGVTGAATGVTWQDCWR